MNITNEQIEARATEARRQANGAARAPNPAAEPAVEARGEPQETPVVSGNHLIRAAVCMGISLILGSITLIFEWRITVVTLAYWTAVGRALWKQGVLWRAEHPKATKTHALRYAIGVVFGPYRMFSWEIGALVLQAAALLLATAQGRL